ncbi:hypothetical protein K431DRAFT_346129 [Polychaeton citri CBS 116435]|uniref:Arylsulfotransferase n=1 Tax=Polychaeton citri CBS 116435 TaxID=1314669 RepID=A0A9P4QBM5_9PEZI|nr:hypothetical protein K431DRAFT_346129 [Polychaeton citri CBS 116435]
MGLFLSFHFSLSLYLAVLGRPDGNNKLSPPLYNATVDSGTYGYYPTNSFATFELREPRTNFLRWSPGCDDGSLYFITPRGYSEEEPGPMILDGSGNLIWVEHFKNTFGGQAYNFMVQSYQGQDYLTFWLGDDTVKGHGTGHYYMQLNSSYDLVHKVAAAGGLSADLHEFLITPEGTVLMTIYQIIQRDVTPLGRVFESVMEHEANYIWDGVFQEIALETGELIFEWRASDHVDITDTYRPVGDGGTRADPFDWFHINSVEKDELGNYLISARYPHVIMYIDGRTGDTIWTLGGKGNDFMDLSDGYATNFAFQHDARFVSAQTFPSLYEPPARRQGFTTKLVSLFDNAAEDRNYRWGLSYSRALLLEVTYPTPDSEIGFTAGDLSTLVTRQADHPGYEEEPLSEDDIQKTKTNNATDLSRSVRVIKSYRNPAGVRSSSQGSVQLIPQADGSDPHLFVGYGLNAVMTEFHPNGTALCDIHFGANTSWERGDIQSYRAYKFPWVGRPRTRPRVGTGEDGDAVLVSWNGATEVVQWLLQSSRSARDGDWLDVATVPRHGFETTIPLSQEAEGSRYLRVVALGSQGEQLENGASEAFDRGYISAMLPGLRFHIAGTAVTPFAVILFLVSSIATLGVLHYTLRRLAAWRSGHTISGFLQLRWNRNAYRLVRGDHEV